MAESAVETFHSQFNAGSYGAIELSAAPEFKTRAGGAKAYLQKVRDIMGTVISSHGGPGSVQSMADGVQVHLVYVTNFVNGQAPETFVFRVKDNRASLVFYEVGAKGLTEN
ncbi:MAG TPA: hypothetical protein VJH03_19385 [Blastocatellia bacterium]|nr:hypothetical protein [Blastocatellia bacterium]